MQHPNLEDIILHIPDRPLYSHEYGALAHLLMDIKPRIVDIDGRSTDNFVTYDGTVYRPLKLTLMKYRSY